MTGKELAEIRKGLGLTQVQFASVLGYNAKTLSDIENGRKPLIESFEKHILLVKAAYELKKLLDTP